jgi:hypothetical protein
MQRYEELLIYPKDVSHFLKKVIGRSVLPSDDLKYVLGDSS